MCRPTTPDNGAPSKTLARRGRWNSTSRANSADADQDKQAPNTSWRRWLVYQVDRLKKFKHEMDEYFIRNS